MKFGKVLGFVAAAAVGYVAARQLMERDGLLERLPGPARPPLVAARTRLLAARQRANAVVTEAKRERDAAEAELLADYARRVGRPLRTASGEELPGTPAAGARTRRPPVWRPGDPL